MTRYTKAFLSIDQQRELLTSRGMVITDNALANDCLRRIGYYRLSAYWYPFRKFSQSSASRGENYVEGTHFESIFALYVFDKKLRLLTLDALERIEIALRTEVALALGRYGPFAYRETEYFSRKFAVQANRRSGLVPHADWLSRFDRKAEHSKEQFALHFRNKYADDPFPIWIAVELLDFGPLSHLLSGMKTVDQRVIAERFALPRPELLTSWVRTLSFVRNVCAHHARLWNKPLIDFPKMPRQNEITTFDHLIDQPASIGRFYTAARIINHFMDEINPNSSWSQRLQNLIESDFPTEDCLSLSAAGFPMDWLEHWRLGNSL